MIRDAHHPTEAELRRIDIHTLLPQQEPFVMVGGLVRYDERLTETETRVSPDNIFVEAGLLSAAGMIENVAQTCAARIGYVNRYILLRGIQIGFIGSVSGLEIHRLPRVGEVVRTRVEVIEEVFGMTLARAVATAGDETLLTTEIKIAVREEAATPKEEAASAKEESSSPSEEAASAAGAAAAPRKEAAQ